MSIKVEGILFLGCALSSPTIKIPLQRMGLSSDSPQGAVAETRSMTGESRSPHLTDDRQPNVVEVDEEPKRDLHTKNAKDQSASLSDYFVSVK